MTRLRADPLELRRAPSRTRGGAGSDDQRALAGAGGARKESTDEIAAERAHHAKELADQRSAWAAMKRDLDAEIRTSRSTWRGRSSSLRTLPNGDERSKPWSRNVRRSAI